MIKLHAGSGEARSHLGGEYFVIQGRGDLTKNYRDDLIPMAVSNEATAVPPVR